MSNVVKASELEYKKYEFKHPSYRFLRTPPDVRNFSIPVNGNVKSVFKLPLNTVFNLAESYIGFEMRIPADVERHIWTYNDTYGMIKAISIYSEGGEHLCNLQEVNNYFKVVGKKETSLQDLLTRDEELNVLIPNNDLKNSRAAIRPENAHSSVNYLEPQYLLMDAVGDNFLRRVRIPLSDFKNTIMEEGRDLYLPQQFTLEIIWAPVAKIGFTTTSVADDTDPSFDPDVIADPVEIKDLVLMVAEEQNEELKAKLIDRVKSGNFEIYVPYVTSKKVQQSSTSHAISMDLTVSNGQRLQKIIHSSFIHPEVKNTAYDCDNVNGGMIDRYQTFLDSTQLQNSPLDCTRKEDYMYHKSMIRGSCLLNSDVYQYNWFHCDDFARLPPPCDKSTTVPNDNLKAGIPLSGDEILTNGGKITWRSEMTTNDLILNHYMWAVCQRVLSCKGLQVTCR